MAHRDCLLFCTIEILLLTYLLACLFTYLLAQDNEIAWYFVQMDVI